MNFSNILPLSFVLIAVLLLVLAVLLLLVWLWMGRSGSILFPGLGIIVSNQIFIIFLLILSIIFIIMAGVFTPKTQSLNSSINQKSSD